MIIRKAVINDVERLISLGHEMHLESRFRHFDFNDHKLRVVIPELIKNHDCLVVVGGEPIQGFFAATCSRMWFGNDLESGDVAFYVNRESRGSSLGVKLLSAYIEWARKMGVKDIKLEPGTGIKQEQMGEFLKHKGFVQVGSKFTLKENESCVVAA